MDNFSILFAWTIRQELKIQASVDLSGAGLSYNKLLIFGLAKSFGTYYFVGTTSRDITSSSCDIYIHCS